MTFDPAQREWIAHCVALDDIAQHYHVHVPGKQGRTVALRGALCFRKASFVQVAPQLPIQRRAFGRAQAFERLGGLCPSVA